MIKFNCAACGKESAAPDEQAGGKHTCSCGNVNIVPAGPRTRGVVYQGKPSQLRNLWLMMGLVIVVVAAPWQLRQFLSTVFKQSHWDWYIALIVILAYVVWLVYRILKLRSMTYTVSTGMILVERGIIFRGTDEVEFSRVKNITMRRSVLQALLGVGDICVELSDGSAPNVVLRSIPEPRAVLEKMREISGGASPESG